MFTTVVVTVHAPEEALHWVGLVGATSTEPPGGTEFDVKLTFAVAMACALVLSVIVTDAVPFAVPPAARLLEMVVA